MWQNKNVAQFIEINTLGNAINFAALILFLPFYLSSGFDPVGVYVSVLIVCLFDLLILRRN